MLVLYGQRVSGRKLQYIFENRPWRDGDPKRKDLIESDGIDFSGYAGNRKNRFDFGGKKERSIENGVEKRPDPEPVAGKKELFPFTVPNSKGPLAIEVVDAFLAFLLVEAQEHFGVRLRAECDSLFDQIVLQFDVVEDFSVKDDGERFVFVVHRLLARGEINDAETRVSKTGQLVCVDAQVVRAAMVDLPGHAHQTNGFYTFAIEV